MPAELIGRCRCPLCGGTGARLSLSRNLLPVLTCNGCQIQLFTRSDRSDQLARALLLKDNPAPAPAPTAQPAPAPSDPPAADPPPVRTETRRAGPFFF